MTNSNRNTTPSRNQSLILFILRNVLGLILIVKGILYLKDTTDLSTLIQKTGIGYFSTNSENLALFISIASIVGGTFIVIGLLTRISSLVQIPILIVAIIFVNIKNISYGPGELILSLFVLVLLIIFIKKGAGNASVDKYFRSLKGKQDLGNTEMNEIKHSS